MADLPCPQGGPAGAHGADRDRQLHAESQAARLSRLAELSDQDRATILAALRYYQQEGMGEPCNRPLWLHDLATAPNGDTISLDDEGIDELYEQLDFASAVFFEIPAREPVERESTGVAGGGRWGVEPMV